MSPNQRDSVWSLRDLGLDPMNAVAASEPAFRFHCAHNRDDRESRYKVDP
jgi:hypothetical protein